LGSSLIPQCIQQLLQTFHREYLYNFSGTLTSRILLPDHPNHPKGRNPYAHVAICVKSKFQKSYKDIEDEKFQEIIDYIEYLKKNPS